MEIGKIRYIFQVPAQNKDAPAALAVKKMISTLMRSIAESTADANNERELLRMTTMILAASKKTLMPKLTLTAICSGDQLTQRIDNCKWVTVNQLCLSSSARPPSSRCFRA
jgi:hypothetical protein